MQIFYFETIMKNGLSFEIDQKLFTFSKVSDITLS